MIPALFASAWTFAPMQFGEAVAMTFAVALFIGSYLAALCEGRP